jgi:YfiH family protein
LLLTSPLLTELGVVHGFSTRVGGVSEGPHESLNLGGKWGDDPAHVATNRARYAERVGFSLERLYGARQVHGNVVLVVDGAAPPLEFAAREADGLATATDGVAVAVLTADCVPLLFADGKGRVAAVHAGWRGAAAEIALRAVEKLESLGARREELRVAWGPSIGPCCFEVGEEVAAAFARWPNAVVRGHAKPHVDLDAVLRAQLTGAGVTQLDARPPCTMCDKARFFSFRRDGGGIGQHLAVIASRAP